MDHPTQDQADKSNVINLHRHKNYALFAPTIRNQLETNLKPFTENPRGAVDVVEQTLCSCLVAGLRQLAVNLGTRAGGAVGRKIGSGL